ncbi:MAG: hypothetical protein Q9165_007136 [Trypethelium subeluteriae]
MLRSSRHRDIESGETEAPARLEGYPTFAEFIASDREAAIYRKYEGLSARNLLYQQSELRDLERQAQELDKADAKNINNGAAQRAARYWKHFSEDENEIAQKRRRLYEKIRVKLREYRTYTPDQA